MKKKLMNAVTSVCALALALTPFFYYKGSSVILFGEPEFPSKENFK